MRNKRLVHLKLCETIGEKQKNGLLAMPSASISRRKPLALKTSTHVKLRFDRISFVLALLRHLYQCLCAEEMEEPVIRIKN